MNAMKDSGIEWLGEIPAHWKICRLKYLAIIKNGQEYKNFFDENGKYPVIGSGGAFSHATKFLYDKPSVLLGRKGTIDKPLFVNFPFWVVDTMYYTEIKNTVLPKFFFYLCLQIPYDYYQYGSALPSMTQRDLNLVKFPLPPIDEQKKISAFLDEKCSAIDSAVDNAKKLVEKFREYKKSLITETVTKGLNPSAKMIDSNVEWLGEIPAHWKIVPMKKYLSSIVDYRGKTPTKVDEGIFLVTARNIKDGRINYELSQEFVKKSDYEEIMHRGKPQIGDVLFTTEAPLGEVANVDKIDIALAQRIIKFSPAENLDSYFLKYCIMAHGFQEFLKTLSTGSTASGIKSSKIFMLKIPLPPLEEQKKIAAFLDEKCSAIDEKISKHEKLAEKLTEYKKSLIYEVVTGKVEV